VVTPSKEVAQRFGELVAPLFARARATTQGSRKLAALRDSLLPKLICGELRVRDAEQLLSEAGI
jgi:type I restriction enzyme S subunit